MACLVLVLLKRWWKALPALGILGGLAKETFVPIAFLFACGWVWREKRKPWVQVCTMAGAGIAVVVLVRSILEGHLVTPPKTGATFDYFRQYCDDLWAP